MEKLKLNVNSEIGKLNGVIVHLPGAEVENMTPENAERALYSDILNLSVALPEYNEFVGVLKKHTRIFEVTTLLADIVKDETVLHSLLKRICENEQNHDENLQEYLENTKSDEIARRLIEGIEMKKNSLTSFLDNEHYSLHPLPNFFFTRDASFTIGNKAMIAKMAKNVRDREAIIMDAIFKNHPSFEAQTVDPVTMFDKSGKGSIEGGDVLVARDDILLIGTGIRTTPEGIDALINYLNITEGKKHIIVQELPYSPESFIHLDMTFTFLDTDKCMIFEPLIINSTRHLTIHITLQDGKVSSIKEEKNILVALKHLGMDLEPVLCGGYNDLTIMEREQWQSGANFVALEPGKVIGYERNRHTVEALNQKGFEVLKAKDVVRGNVKLEDYKKAVITIKGNELSRGGGGARCMTMPLNREAVSW